MRLAVASCLNQFTSFGSQLGCGLVTLLSERISRSFKSITHRKFSVVNIGLTLSSALELVD